MNKRQYYNLVYKMKRSEQFRFWTFGEGSVQEFDGFGGKLGYVSYYDLSQLNYYIRIMRNIQHAHFSVNQMVIDSFQITSAMMPAGGMPRYRDITKVFRPADRQAVPTETNFWMYLFRLPLRSELRFLFDSYPDQLALYDSFLEGGDNESVRW